VLLISSARGFTSATIPVDSKKLVEAYGYADWYDFANFEWGTKWNACDTSIVEDSTVMFSTAWDAPHAFFDKLAEQMPDSRLEITVEHEDGGGGEYVIENGMYIENTRWDSPHITHIDDSGCATAIDRDLAIVCTDTGGCPYVTKGLIYDPDEPLVTVGEDDGRNIDEYIAYIKEYYVPNVVYRAKFNEKKFRENYEKVLKENKIKLPTTNQ